MGTFCAVAGVIVEHFQSIFQVINTVAGITTGAIFGAFTIGMLYPWANQKGALSGMIISMAVLCPIITNTQYAISQGKLRYEILPTRIDGCNNETIASFQNL